MKKPKRPLPRPTKPLPRSTQPIAKVNPDRLAKRHTKQRQHYASKAYKDARTIAHGRACGQCEALYARTVGEVATPFLPSDTIPARYTVLARCPMTTTLEFHETEYGSDLGILREIDGYILCERDHAYIERTRHPTRRHGQ
jgi:hypothetical protein